MIDPRVALNTPRGRKINPTTAETMRDRQSELLRKQEETFSRPIEDPAVVRREERIKPGAVREIQQLGQSTTAETPTMATRPPKYVGVRGPIDGMHELHPAGSYLELTVVERDAVRHWLISRSTAELLRDEINGILNEPKD